MSWSGSHRAARQQQQKQQKQKQQGGVGQTVEGGLAGTLWGARPPLGAAFTPPPLVHAPPPQQQQQQQQHLTRPHWPPGYAQEQQHAAAHGDVYFSAPAGAPLGARRLPLADWTLRWGARARHAARTALMPGTMPSYLLFGLIIVMLTAVLLLLLLKPPAPAAAGAAAQTRRPQTVTPQAPLPPPPPPRPPPPAQHKVPDVYGAAQTLRLPFCVGRLLAVGDGRDPRAQAHAEQACAAEPLAAAAAEGQTQADAVAPYVHYRTYNVSLLGAGRAARVPSYTCCCFDRSLSVCQGFSMGGSPLYTVSGLLKRDAEGVRGAGGGAEAGAAGRPGVGPESDSGLGLGSTWRLLLGVGSGFRFNETYCALDLYVEGGATAARLAERVGGPDGVERWRPLPSEGAGSEHASAPSDVPPPQRTTVAHGRSDDDSQTTQTEDADDLVRKL